MRSRERETAMNSDFRDKLSNAATAVEITLGMVILIACIVSGIGMVAMTDMNKLFGDPAYLQARMSSACLIIIGIELIKMITSYTIDSVVDVMLLAIARQMIVEHTSPIENLISVPQTTGAQLADNLRSHINHYPIDLFEDRKIEKAELQGKEKRISVVGGEVFISPSVIIATGASWRKLNVEGETEYIGRGVAFCPHCDGPFYQGKDIAVIGGGNSGIEAAIDLAGICRKVTVFEFADTLKADQVLQEKAQSLPNVEIFTSSQTTKVVGNGDKVTAIRVKDRVSSEERDFPLDGIFVQIGLAANSAPFRDMLETTPIGEIKIDAFCRTTLPGVYAAGDVSDVPYKQIVIAMGEGAKAALSAFDDRIRGIA
mgnify:CR=1 FL=1